MEYEIIDKKLNFKNPQLILSKSRGNIGNIPREVLYNLIAHFEELRSIKKESYKSSDLKEVNEIIRKRHMAKVRVLKKEENMGFITIGSITIVGFLILAFVIFAAVGNIVGR